MSEVFVSYKREDLTVVSRLVDALRKEGLDVWWDLDIPPNAAWERTIEQQLAAARVIVVAWSPAAVASENVRAEARWARQQGRLLQVFVETCTPPLFFGERQGVDLRGWSGAATDPAFRALLRAIREAPRASADTAPPYIEPSAPGMAAPARAAPDNGATFAPGMVLNDLFVVQRLVGRGPVGEIYEGANLATGERVAIKTFAPEATARPELRDGFLREMRVLTRLNHPAIVTHRLAAREPTRGVLYLVSEFIDGIALEALIGQVTAPELRLRALIERLAQALKHAHDLGVVHRELAADTILAPGGRLDECKIIDFGISENFDAVRAAILEAAGASRPYAAPEQREAGAPLGPWTDVYSLGAVMLALATGVRPAVGAHPPLSRAPPGLRSLFEGMLEPDPGARFRSTDEVLAALGQSVGEAGAAARRRQGFDVKAPP